MKIIVDKSKCSSIGLCEATAADIFEIGADGALHILMDDISEDRRAPQCAGSNLAVDL